MSFTIEIGTDEQKKLPVSAEVNYISLTQDRKIVDIHNGGLIYESPKPLGFSSWEDILENNGGSRHMPFQPLFPEMQPDDMAVSSNFCQGYDIMVPHLATSMAKLHDNGSLIQAEGSWQVLCTGTIGTSFAWSTFCNIFMSHDNI